MMIDLFSGRIFRWVKHNGDSPGCKPVDLVNSIPSLITLNAEAAETAEIDP